MQASRPDRYPVVLDLTCRTSTRERNGSHEKRYRGVPNLTGILTLSTATLHNNIKIFKTFPPYIKTHLDTINKNIGIHMEQFVDIIEFSNYQVSNIGNIKNKKTGRILSQSNSGKGYMKVNLMKDGNSYTKRVHIIVCEHFNPNPGHLPQVDHKDEDKANNSASNLRWCTHQQNIDWHYENNPNKRAKNSSLVYGSLESMVDATGKHICVNGLEFNSCGSAAKYICDTSGKNQATVSKELRRMLAGKREFGTMYGEYVISRPCSKEVS